MTRTKTDPPESVLVNETVTTIPRIREIARDARPELDSYMNCNPINPDICSALSKHGIPAETTLGMVSTKYRGYGDEHMFVVIDESGVQGVSSDVIVDGALDQFCISNLDSGRVWESLGPKEDIPCPAVLTRGDELYSVFSTRRPA